MRKGRAPEEIEVGLSDDRAVLEALHRVWSGEIDAIMVMRSAGEYPES